MKLRFALERISGWWHGELAVPVAPPAAPPFAAVVASSGVPVVISLRGVECPVVPGVWSIADITDVLGDVETLPEVAGARGFVW